MGTCLSRFFLLHWQCQTGSFGITNKATYVSNQDAKLDPSRAQRHFGDPKDLSLGLGDPRRPLSRAEPIKNAHSRFATESQAEEEEEEEDIETGSLTSE